jgi:hypothetical protein
MIILHKLKTVKNQKKQRENLQQPCCSVLHSCITRVVSKNRTKQTEENSIATNSDTGALHSVYLIIVQVKRKSKELFIDKLVRGIHNP